MQKWQQELIFIKRDANGVIAAISERTPEGYVEEKSTDESRFHSNTNTVSSPVENIIIQNIEEQENHIKHIERAERAINRLGTRHQKLIRARFMEDDYVSDTDVAAELGYSDRHYRRSQWQSIDWQVYLV
ncbi:hypothetical protein [Paenibacillus periandrae]|uniref:hypothetical protein n=1 Tax=Paenibacillus periandrae TaxID=1761741 RepID=UPI001F0909B2|nr:hypothetical protein [Paenibacillus periandrae]